MVQSRIGRIFHREIERIKDQRLREGTSRDRVATEKLTNMIAKHQSWLTIKRALIKISEKELNNYGRD